MSEIEDIAVRKGAWSFEEDALLKRYIEKHGEGNWSHVPARADLKRCRKSCRLRWLNYLRPNIKRGHFATDEIDMISRLHNLLGNKWSLIAGRIPGRTANDIKNYWNAHLSKKPAINWNTMTTKKKKTEAGGVPFTKVAETCSGKVIKPQPRTLISNIQWFGPEYDGNKQVSDLPQLSISMMDQQITPIWKWNGGYHRSTTGSGSGVNNTAEVGGGEDEFYDNFWEELFERVIDM